MGVAENMPSTNRVLGSIPITKKKEEKEGESRERKKREIQFHCPLSHCPYVPAKRIASYGDRITKTVCTANTTRPTRPPLLPLLHAVFQALTP